MSDKSGEFSEMTAIAEASSLVRSLAEPYQPGEGVKAAVQRASRKLSDISPSRVRDLWYADPRINVSADEMKKIKAAAGLQQLKEEELARDELRAINERLARIEAILANAYPAGPVGHAPVETVRAAYSALD